MTHQKFAPFVQWLGHQIFTLETGVQFPYGVPLWSHSSVGRAPALQAGGHRFKSYCDHHFYWGCSSVWLERLPVTQEVASSSLVTPAIIYAALAHLVEQLTCNQ